MVCQYGKYRHLIGKCSCKGGQIASSNNISKHPIIMIIISTCFRYNNVEINHHQISQITTLNLKRWISFGSGSMRIGGGDETVEHIKIRETLVTSGKFHVGEAQYAIEQMVKSGEIFEVKFHKYKKGSFDK
jgi:hypothetical protein